MVIKSAMTAVLLLMLASCTHGITDSPDQDAVECTDFCRSLDEGIKAADIVLSKICKGTRANSRIIKSIEPFNLKTRSKSTTSTFYIINYEGNNGFALLSADKRLEPVFAISDSGHMHLSDTIHNKPLALYIRSIEDMANNFGIQNPPGFDTIVAPDKKSTTVVVLEPLFKEGSPNKILSQFHQFAPYNNYCFTLEGWKAPVGCAPLAAGTIMGYYEWPKSHDGYTFDWTAMKADSNHDGWAKLFSYIGQPGNMNVSYGRFETGANPGNYCKTFQNFGYKNMSLKNFSTYYVDSELSKGKPLMVRGTDDNEGGHAWVIDGAKYMKDPFTVPNETITHYYYHCIWGWEESNNGYFLFQNNISVNNLIFKSLQFIYNLEH